MPLYTSDFIYTPEGWKTHYVLETNEAGMIVELRPLKEEDETVYHSGVLCPGFINAHCHLELSSLKGMIPEKTGMAGFVKEVVGQRVGISETQHLEAIKQAMEEAWESGTVAIGDICNTPLTIENKRTHALFTHSFIELLGLNSEKVAEILEGGEKLSKQFGNLNHSLTSHAPYSMSKSLIRQINEHNSSLLSVHLLESKEEIELFKTGGGTFAELYRQWGIPFHKFEDDKAIPHITTGMLSSQAVIFIHNTEMEEDELNELAEQFPHAFFCLCPRSNEYIHATFPDIHMFMSLKDRVCLGTDSLGSNHSLEMLEELKTIQKYYPEIDLHTLLKWLTTNGAHALQQGINFGIFAPGLQPGINLITHTKIIDSQPSLTPESGVLKLK